MGLSMNELKVEGCRLSRMLTFMISRKGRILAANKVQDMMVGNGGGG